MGVALALAERTRGATAPNPNVGCVIVADGRVVGRGWTQAGGRPHAEAMALAEAGDAARGATAYVTLEPCAHLSARGPACSDLLVAAGVTRVVAALRDPDPRTAGAGFARLETAGIAVETGMRADAARRSMAGFLARRRFGRPQVTLKLATSLDGCIAMADGTSRWITGPQARAHAHLERSRHEAILIGRGTYVADAPRLDVRLAGLESRAPRRVMLSGSLAPSASPLASALRHPSEGWGLAEGQGRSPQQKDPSLRWGDGEGEGDGPGDGAGRRSEAEGEGWTVIARPAEIATLDGVDHILVEGGAQTAAAFLAADLVDRLLLYRAPILIGGGLPAIGAIGIDLSAAHGRWTAIDARQLGSDRLEVYERARSD
ncbi:bifunctional diaminohydroxyphosphoribosylaminopyrimidine deaminase/5-amino-6-(5-phosphoribosylamino)uracil reductase RibD [Sphingomonas ginsenosidivorax]|uniref:Riboflavin biosynthesis protein RibD n=1 Tax=Sphingomonas ginsenosidivorax TaxID=862135 RepID=A0A5C6UHM2_9SPHN|nr:bifunctional diaminohydroxyphosphoribosylaminopyrimidine deaminase/5-amino-6-(5-phosphoribosylamino)uracil reductase RibD [Sphingomonas ginsenosidivorax]